VGGERLPGGDRRRPGCPRLRGPGRTRLAPRTIKDEIEEALFARGRDLFTDLSVVFMDTTSLSFTGAGGATLGKAIPRTTGRTSTR